MGEIDDIINEISPYYKKRNGPSKIHKLTYDSPTESLEPIYFWILDFARKITGGNVEKILDNFASSPGSGHFSELGAKKSQMQEQASRMMATINNILRSVLNLIYDLKEFRIRLSHYDYAKSSNKEESDAGVLALKQIWLDKVDIQRGQGSINALSSGNLQFVTLRDAFFSARKPDDVDKIDLNERVKRLLKPRVQEFFEWRKRSELELRKRYEIEKTYLKSQVDSLKLQSRWAKPYLKAAEKLEQDQNLESDAALVTAFNTIILQLTLLGKSEMKVGELTDWSRQDGFQLPEDFKRIAKKIRKTFSVVVVNFKFTGIPSKSGQHYLFGGKSEIEFKSYALNEDELDLMKEKLSESDLFNALRLVQGMTDDSLAQLKIDIDELLEDDDKKDNEVIDPFSAIFQAFQFKKKKSDKEIKKEKIEKLKKKGIKKDKYSEAYVRNIAIADAIDKGFSIYDTLKKAYGMASFPYGGGIGEIGGMPPGPKLPPQTAADKFFGFK